MKKHVIPILLLLLSIHLSVFSQCPTFAEVPYPSVSYNLNATPWEFALDVSGDTTGATVQWYRFVKDAETIDDAVPYTGPGSNTVSHCYPQTDDAMRNTWYYYFCVISTPSCPQGVVSHIFDVQVARESDCMTMEGTSFYFISAPSTFDEGTAIQLTAYYSGYGGFHYYTWSFNGEPLQEDANHIILNDPDNFNYSVLTIPACEVTDAGSYSVTVMDGPTCQKTIAAPKVITVKPITDLVFDDNNGTHVWSDTQNWWPRYNRVPTASDSAIIRARCEVDVPNAVTNDLTLDVQGDSVLIIRPMGALKVARKLINCQSGALLIEANADATGALLLSSANTDVPATVQFYARSTNSTSAAPVWQYMGYPMQDHPSLSEAYAGAELYEWTNTPNARLGGNWQESEGTARAEAFKGYCMTEPAEKVYSFPGVLNNPVTMNIPVPYNDQGTYPGFAFLANSWVAPIDIALLDVADFGAADATVYIMNTGTYNEAKDAQESMSPAGVGTDRGQYNAVPVHAAAYLPNALHVIPAMQGFFVHTTAATTLSLDYNKSVYASSPSTTTARAPQRRMDEVPAMLHLVVNGFGHSDEVYILEDEVFTDGFDNGWEGRKAPFSEGVQLSVLSEDGELAVAAVPLAEGVKMSLTGGLDKSYTIAVAEATGDTWQELYLYDPTTGVYTPLTEGSRYTYVYTREAEPLTIARIGESSTPIKAKKYIKDAHLMIQVDGRVYNAIGSRIH